MLAHQVKMSKSTSCSALLAMAVKRSFTSSPNINKHFQMPPRPKLNEEDIEGTYLKGTGPGGQKINKTSSAVQLIHKPTGIVVKSQATRSQSQNRKIAHQILAEKVEMMEKGADSRLAIKTERARKKKASKSKKSKRKYRALEEAKAAQRNGEGSGMEEADDMLEEAESAAISGKHP